MDHINTIQNIIFKHADKFSDQEYLSVMNSLMKLSKNYIIKPGGENPNDADDVDDVSSDGDIDNVSSDDENTNDDLNNINLGEVPGRSPDIINEEVLDEKDPLGSYHADYDYSQECTHSAHFMLSNYSDVKVELIGHHPPSLQCNLSDYFNYLDYLFLTASCAKESRNINRFAVIKTARWLLNLLDKISHRQNS
jgi:hypothetical protein